METLAVLVCHCLRVTDREINEAVRQGAHDLESVADACGAGAGCGGCQPLVERLIQLGLSAQARNPESLRPACAWVGQPGRSGSTHQLPEHERATHKAAPAPSGAESATEAA